MLNFRERSHRALLIALRELFRNSIEHEFLDSFEQGLDLREEADYSMTYSEESAEGLVQAAQGFLAEAKGIVKIES